ncbi:hypothetical protein ACO0QE_000758 [Hanseniaspora vineae]
MSTSTSKLSDPHLSSQNSLSSQDHQEEDGLLPLLISVVDENVNKSDNNQWYLTKNIHYIFTDDDEDQTDLKDQEQEDELLKQDQFQTGNDMNKAPETGSSHLISPPRDKKNANTSNTKETVIILDVDKHFRLENVEFISDSYRLLNYSTIQKARSFDVSKNPGANTSQEKSTNLQSSSESTDIQLTVLSKFSHDPHIADSRSLNELITIYKKQNEQLLDLLDTLE